MIYLLLLLALCCSQITPAVTPNVLPLNKNINHIIKETSRYLHEKFSENMRNLISSNTNGRPCELFGICGVFKSKKDIENNNKSHKHNYFNDTYIDEDDETQVAKTIHPKTYRELYFSEKITNNLKLLIQQPYYLKRNC